VPSAPKAGAAMWDHPIRAFGAEGRRRHVGPSLHKKPHIT
jgi:hypothetical protein